MKRLLSKVEEMKQQRQMLETQIRDQMQNDDITKRVVAAGKDADVQVSHFFINQKILLDGATIDWCLAAYWHHKGQGTAILFQTNII